MRIWKKKNKEFIAENIDLIKSLAISPLSWTERKMGESAGITPGHGTQGRVEALREVVQSCDRLGVEFLTVYAFSTENWKRPNRKSEF